MAAFIAVSAAFSLTRSLRLTYALVRLGKEGSHVFKVELPGGVMVHVENMDQVREVVHAFSANGTKTTAAAAAAIAEESPAPDQANPEAPKKAPRGAIYSPTEVKIRSVSTAEALFKLYKGLDNATHVDVLRFLASKGETGASVEEIKEALKLPEKYKFGGLTAAIRRRAPHYGLEPEQVLIVEYRGIVANFRILDYKLGPEMLEMMQAHGFIWKPRGGKQQG
jgi:hypothetical protein